MRTWPLDASAHATAESTLRSVRRSKPLKPALLASALAALAALGTTAVLHARQFGPWQAAVSVDPGRAGVNTSANDGCPIEAPDGLRLVIASNRPGTLGMNDLWVSSRASEDDPWGAPVNPGRPINSEANDFCPTPLPGNRLLFVSTRANNCGGSGNNPDIYYTQWNPAHGWREPVPLSCEVNSGFEEFSPSLVESDGVTMLFFSSNRDTAPAHKIYVSVLQPDGTFTAARQVHELNFPGASDARPNVRKDGLEVVFDSTRAGGPPQIYTATRGTLFEAWSPPVRLDAAVNLPGFAQTRPSLSWDGTRLYFGSTRANLPGDAAGASDVFVASRSGPGRGGQPHR
jgi:Tol biopolymer transport system component